MKISKVNLAQSDKPYNYYTPLTCLVEEHEPTTSNEIIKQRIVPGKGKIRFEVPVEVHKYRQSNNKQAEKWRRRMIRKRIRQTANDEATNFNLGASKRAAKEVIATVQTPTEEMDK